VAIYGFWMCRRIGIRETLCVYSVRRFSGFYLYLSGSTTCTFASLLAYMLAHMLASTVACWRSAHEILKHDSWWRTMYLLASYHTLLSYSASSGPFM